MKPATPLDAGTVKTTTITTRTLPEIGPNDKTPDLWEYLRALQPQDWPKHMVYGYRQEPGPKVQIFRCTEPLLTMPGGQRVPIADEQELEYALTRDFGGGVYRFLVKRGPQIITAGNMEIGAPARAIRIPVENQNGQPAGNGSTVTPFAGVNDPTAAVARAGFDALGNQERTAAEIGFAAMRTGLDAVTRAVDIQRNGNGSGQDDILRQVLIAKLNENPMAQVLQLLTVLKELNALMGNASAAGVPSGMMEKIFSAMFEKFMNPAPTGAPVSATAEIARAVPGALSNLVEVIREQRLLSDNQVKFEEMRRGAGVVRPATMPNPQVIPPAVPPGPTPKNGSPPGVPSMEFIEARILEIFQRAVSAEQAADDALAFLDGLDPNATAQLAALGETGLLQFFQTRPMLKPACGNMARLVEFIRAFLRMHAEDVAQNGAATAQQPKAPPLPN